MLRKMAGHTPLQLMIDQTINDSRTKIAASEKEEKERKAPPFAKKDDKGEKKDDKEEKEKKSSAIINTDSSAELEKFASALEAVGDEFVKESSDSVFNGGESPQGGGQLPTGNRVPGVQPWHRGGSKSHNIPLRTGTEASSDGNSGNHTATPTDEKRAPGTGKAYPTKGVLKTAFALTEEGHKLDAARYGAISKGNHDIAKAEDRYARDAPVKAHMFRPAQGAIHRIVSRHSDYAAAKHEKGQNAYNPFGGLGGKSRHEKKEKQSSAENPAVDFILNKIAESKQGGESAGEYKSGEGPKPASDSKGGNDARKGIDSNQAVVNMTKSQAKAPQKRMLSEVLSEPAFSREHDPVVHDNLRNAAKSGVKIAAAQKAFLQKIASDPSDPRHEKLKVALAKHKAAAQA